MIALNASAADTDHRSNACQTRLAEIGHSVVRVTTDAGTTLVSGVYWTGLALGFPAVYGVSLLWRAAQWLVPGSVKKKARTGSETWGTAAAFLIWGATHLASPHFGVTFEEFDAQTRPVLPVTAHVVALNAFPTEQRVHSDARLAIEELKARHPSTDVWSGGSLVPREHVRWLREIVGERGPIDMLDFYVHGGEGSLAFPSGNAGESVFAEIQQALQGEILFHPGAKIRLIVCGEASADWEDFAAKLGKAYGLDKVGGQVAFARGPILTEPMTNLSHVFHGSGTRESQAMGNALLRFTIPAGRMATVLSSQVYVAHEVAELERLPGTPSPGPVAEWVDAARKAITNLPMDAKPVSQLHITEQTPSPKPMPRRVSPD